jgi:hypothetical protein
MTPNVYAPPNERRAQDIARAFAAGCGGHVRTHYVPGPWAGFGSPGTWDGLMETRRAGHDFYYGDHAYFGRHQFFRFTKNAWQHRGTGTGSTSRLRPFYRNTKPWHRGKNAGRDIIICPQSDAYHQRMGWNLESWIESIQARLALATDRPLIIRSKNDKRPLSADLMNAWCVITHASNAAVEAIMNGVPAICTGDCAASIMSGSDPLNVEYPFYPDGRMEWASVLAANQWTLAEIRNGECWKALEHEKI